MGWLIAFAILLIIALLPVGLRARYDFFGPFAAIVIGPVSIQLFPRVQKKNAKPKPEKSVKPDAKKSGTGGSVRDFLPLVKLVLDFLNGFRKRLRINNLKMKLILGGEDPCDLALNYGKGWATLGNILPLLEQVFVIKKRDLEVECDFLADRTTVTASADITIRIWHILALAVIHGPKLLKEYFGIMKIRKGGAKT